jgi:hypothetical protein
MALVQLPVAAARAQELIETVVYCEDFEKGPAGWMPSGVTPEENFWHLDEGTWSCATEVTCPVCDGPGYGNFWNAALSKTYALPAGSAGLDLHHAYDTEPGYDFCLVEVLPQGGSEFVVLDYFDGNSGGLASSSVDLTPYAGTTVEVRLRFQSDFSWSDEDGLYCTDGAWRIARVQVTNHPEEVFTSDGQGWTPVPTPPDLASFRLESNPLCNPPAQYLIDHHGITTLNCDHPSPCTPPAKGNAAWVAYDPATGLIPDVPAGYDRDFIPGIESPAERRITALSLTSLRTKSSEVRPLPRHPGLGRSGPGCSGSLISHFPSRAMRAPPLSCGRSAGTFWGQPLAGGRIDSFSRQPQRK